MNIALDAKRAFHNTRGLGNYSRDLIRMLQEYKVGHLYLFNPQKRKFLGVKIDENTTEITPQSFFWKKLKSLWRSLKITAIARDLPIDIYHGLSGEIPRNIHRYIPTVVTIHDLIFMRYPQLYSFFDRKMHYRKFLYAAHNAQHIIAISEQTKQDIIHYLGVPENKISVVYQGCHKAFKQTYTEAEKAAVRTKYQLPERFVLNVGAVGKQTAYYQQIRNYAQQHHMEHRVQALTGVTMEELAIIYQLSEVFCYPSVFEGFGIPIIEALFSGVPVITTQGSCFPEAGGEGSIYISLDNAADEICEAIKRISSDRVLREEMIEKGYAHAQHFTDEAVYQQLMAVYKKNEQL